MRRGSRGRPGILTEFDHEAAGAHGLAVGGVLLVDCFRLHDLAAADNRGWLGTALLDTRHTRRALRSTGGGRQPKDKYGQESNANHARAAPYACRMHVQPTTSTRSTRFFDQTFFVFARRRARAPTHLAADAFLAFDAASACGPLIHRGHAKLPRS
jgi:hypothetical protein